jgi:Trk K+ transport system NAD-binding subunit
MLSKLVGGTTVICGLERLSLRVARALIQLGERVIVVADKPQPGLLNDLRRAGGHFVPGRSDELATLPDAEMQSARCLVLTENADLGNLEAAMTAREVNPNLRVVMRMFNTEMADSVLRLLPNSRVLSASLEAAPYFAADALGVSTSHTRHVWGRHLAVLPAPQETAGDSPRLLVDEDGTDGSGSAHVKLSETHLLGPVEPPRLPKHRSWRRISGYRRAVRTFFDLRLAITASAIATLLGVTVTVFHFAMRLTWIDSLYFTVTTASTVGYGDITLLSSPWWLKLYGVGFMFGAALSLATLFALATDAVIGARILEALGVPRGGMRNHVVVVGLGNTGYRVTQLLLDAGVEVAAADVSERNRFVGVARRQRVPVLIADGRFRDSLHALSAENARAVVAVSDDDLANLETALTARSMSSEAIVVARLWDSELTERAQRELGINVCHSMSALAAPAFVAAALGEGVLSTIEHDGNLWVVGEVSVGTGSALDGATTTELELAGGLHVLAVRHDGADRWRPEWPDALNAGCEVLVACGRERWERMRSQAVSDAAGLLASSTMN